MITKIGLSEGPQGIAETLAQMRDLIVQSDTDRTVKETAVGIIKDIDPKDSRAQIEAIVEWVRVHMKYVKDIYGVEELQAPRVHLTNIANQGYTYGDCDDFSVMIGALLRAAGYQTRLEALAVDANVYNHARLSVIDPSMNEWLAIEGTQPWELGKNWPSQLQVMFIEP